MPILNIEMESICLYNEITQTEYMFFYTYVSCILHTVYVFHSNPQIHFYNLKK